MQQRRVNLGIDTLSGEGNALYDWIQAAQIVARRDPNIYFHFAGPEREIMSLLSISKIPPTASILNSEYYFGLDRKVRLFACEGKVQGKDDETTYKKLVELHKKGGIEAIISANDTSIIARFNKKIFGYQSFINKSLALPYIVEFPNRKLGSVTLLDVGGTQEWNDAQQVLFLAMGVAFSRMNGREMPRVAFLSNGVEMLKGHANLRNFLKKALPYLQNSSKFEYVGKREGVDLLTSDDADVYITDGFTGNMIIKNTSGTGRFVFQTLEDQIKATNIVQKALAIPLALMLAGICSPQLLNLRERLSPSNFSGSVYYGLAEKYAVAKAHGSSGVKEKVATIMKTADAIRKGDISSFNGHFQEIYASFPPEFRNFSF